MQRFIKTLRLQLRESIIDLHFPRSADVTMQEEEEEDGGCSPRARMRSV